MAGDMAEGAQHCGDFMSVLSTIPTETTANPIPPASANFVVQRAPDAPRLDLGRDVHCLFGLTFDAVTLDEAAQRLRRDAHEQRPCFVSTPNVNFVVAAQTDSAFRNSVLRSDLSLADGMPIVWAARLMGVPIRQRVAGSDLFEMLHKHGADALKVFFFGGPDGVAAQAAQALNAQGGGLECVGYESPGFGSIQDISSDAQIERINASGADFVVVALGAKKGQAWIEHNRHRLRAPLISHLGAVVNFVAGSVDRAPLFWRRVGLEWLWRVKEEPALWRRYFHDGHLLAQLVLTRVLPCAIAVTRRRWGRGADVVPRHDVISMQTNRSVIRLSGPWAGGELLSPLKQEVAKLLRDGTAVQFDLSEATWVDSALLGFLLLLNGWQRDLPALLPSSRLQPDVQRLFRWHGAESLAPA